MIQKCWAICSRSIIGQFSSMQISASTSYNQVRTVRSHNFSPWWIRPKHPFVQEHVTPENQAFMEDVTAEMYKQKAQHSPLKSEPLAREPWVPGSVRTGLIAKKIGYFPQWTKDGKHLKVTLLQIQDNHVISYTDPITWYKQSRVGKKEGLKRLGRLTLGVNPQSPRQFNAAYRGLFEKSGVMPKERLASFAITPNAKIQPGTRLFATHFRVGQYVDLWGRTIDRGFQGVMKRWGFAGGPASHGTTKAHRRPGSIGMRQRKYVIVGRKMAGQMGNVWRRLLGVQIIRINTKYQVLYVRATGVMGNIGNYLYVKDSGLVHRRVENPPFPTHYPEEEKEPLPEEFFHEKLFQFTQPTVMFEEKEEPKLAVGVKVKKQAKAQVKKP